MSLQNAALKYADASAKRRKAAEPLAEFDRILKQWELQRQFRWGGINLEMTDEIADAFRGQLLAKITAADFTLLDALEELQSYART